MNNDIYTVIDFQHVKPGKGAAFVYIKVKSLTTGRVLEQNIPASHKVDDVRIERRPYQYLYTDEAGLNFMNNESFDQIAINDKMVDGSEYLKDGDMVIIVFNATTNEPLTCEVPQNVWLTVTYSEPGAKGDTATNTLKPATLETGVEVRVPLFINEGDLIKVDTTTGAYMERAKK